MRSRSRSPNNETVSLMISIPVQLYNQLSLVEFHNKLKQESFVDQVSLEGDSNESILSISSAKISTKLHALSIVINILGS